MAIVISGGWRTGSTVMFNLVKDLTGWPGEGAESPSSKVNRVYKIHAYTGDEIKIHTYRDYDSAAKSMRRVGFDDDKIIRCICWNYLTDQMNLKSGVFCIDYNDLINNPLEVFLSTEIYLDSLFIKTNDIDYNYYTRIYQLPLTQNLTEADSVTQYRTNHISMNDFATVELSERVKRFIMSLDHLEL